MEVRRFKDLLAIKSPDQEIWGFHAYNLDIASLSEELWSALADENSLRRHPEQLQELEDWNNEISSEAQDAWHEAQDTRQRAHHKTDIQHKACGPLKAPKIKKLSLNIAQICNLKCGYCAAGGDGTYGSDTSKIDTSIAQEQIRYFLALSAKAPKNPSYEFDIRFLGGEPLLYPSVIRELCLYAALCAAGQDNLHLTFSVTTNGTLITPKVADMLADLRFAVTISLDGQPEVNDRTRPAKTTKASSTIMTLKGISELQRVRPQLRALNVNSVFGDHNMKIHDAYLYITSLGVKWDEINLLYSNNEQNEFNNRLYIEEMRRVAETAFRRGGLAELSTIKQFQAPLVRIAARTRIHSYCGAGKSLIQADTRGDLYACNWFMNDPDEKIGARTRLKSDKIMRYQNSFIELNDCQACWARHLCGGGCLAVHKSQTSDKHKKDPDFCERTRAIASMAIHYYAKSFVAESNAESYTENKSESHTKSKSENKNKNDEQRN